MRSIPQDSPTLFDGQICSKCGIWKPLDEYHVDRKKANGHHCYCKACSKLVRSNAYKTNKVALDDYALRYQYVTQRTKWLAYQRELNKDARRRAGVSARPLFASQEERMAARRIKRRLWQQQNKARVKAIQHRRRALVARTGGSFSAHEWDALCMTYGNVCLCCREQKPLHADHVIPVSRGGSSDISNIQPLCKSCNSKKSTRTIDYRLTFHNP